MSKTIRQKGIIDTKLIAREKDWDSFAEDTLRPLRAAQGRELT
jgi:hypothetical protein